MLNLTDTMQDFTENYTWNMETDLAVKIIEQMGGEANFIAQCQAILENGMEAGVNGFNNTNDLMTFFENNEKNLIQFARDTGSNTGVGSGIEFIHIGVSEHGYNMDEVCDALYEVTSKVKQPSNIRIVVCAWLVWAAVQDLCHNYASFFNKAA